MKLFYRTYGKGQPLIILHGLFGSSDNWVTIAKHIGERFTVYLPDMRNHGKSPHSDIHDYESLRDDVFELINDLKLKKVFLAGHSMGGKAALSFALKWPEMLNGLLIADISAFENKARYREAYLQHVSILETILSTDISSASTREDINAMLSEKLKSEKIRALVMKSIIRNRDKGFSWELNAQSLLMNIDKIMEGIDRPGPFTTQITGFPVIFLKGENSDYLPYEDFKDILKIFPAAEFVEVRGAGHWVQADRPDVVEENLNKLLPNS